MTPSPDRLEGLADVVRRELDGLLAEARDIYRELQDVDAEEPVAGVLVSPTIARRFTLENRLRAIERQVTLAHCELVPPADDRAAAAQRVAGDLRRPRPTFADDGQAAA